MARWAMPLISLEPEWVRYQGDGKGWPHVKTLAEANGLIFVCPECLVKQGGYRPGCHSILCWTPEVPAGVNPGPGRWSFHGTGLSDLTLRAGSSSIHLTGPGCGAHFFIENGLVYACD